MVTREQMLLLLCFLPFATAACDGGTCDTCATCVDCVTLHRDQDVATSCAFRDGSCIPTIFVPTSEKSQWQFSQSGCKSPGKKRFRFKDLFKRKPAVRPESCGGLACTRCVGLPHCAFEPHSHRCYLRGELTVYQSKRAVRSASDCPAAGSGSPLLRNRGKSRLRPIRVVSPERERVNDSPHSPGRCSRGGCGFHGECCCANIPTANRLHLGLRDHQCVVAMYCTEVGGECLELDSESPRSASPARSPSRKTRSRHRDKSRHSPRRGSPSSPADCARAGCGSDTECCCGTIPPIQRLHLGLRAGNQCLVEFYCAEIGGECVESHSASEPSSPLSKRYTSNVSGKKDDTARTCQETGCVNTGECCCVGVPNTVQEMFGLDTDSLCTDSSICETELKGACGAVEYRDYDDGLLFTEAELEQQTTTGVDSNLCGFYAAKNMVTTAYRAIGVDWHATIFGIPFPHGQLRAGITEFTQHALGKAFAKYPDKLADAMASVATPGGFLIDEVIWEGLALPFLPPAIEHLLDENKVIVFPPTLASMIAAQPDEIPTLLFDAQPSPNVLILPLNHHNLHWSVLVFDVVGRMGAPKSFYHLDSLRSNSHRKFAREIAVLIDAAFENARL